MKNTLLFSLLLSLTTLSSWAGPSFWERASAPPQFCFQNFNAYGPLYASGLEARTQGLLGHLKDFPKCDIVQLQEVWMESHITHIETSLREQYHFSSPNRDTRIGIMALIMGDILSRETFTFAVNSSGSLLDRARGVASVDKAFHVLRVQLPALDEELYVINTHLHPSSQAVRLTQILDLLQWRLRHQNLKLLLSGDFNSDPQDLERRLLMTVVGLRDAMADGFPNSLYPKEFCTYCKSNPLSWLPSDHVFDYIFYSNAGGPETSLKITATEVNLKGSAQKPLSDHYGIRAYFSLEPGKPQDVDLEESQRRAALQSLAEAIQILDQERGSPWKVYQRLARELRDDLQRSRSDYEVYLKQSLQ